MNQDHRSRVHQSLDRCAAADASGGALERRWRAVFKALDEAREALEPDAWRWLTSELREHELFASAMDEPVTRRAHQKPRGYAGDAVTMDMLYRGGTAAPPEAGVGARRLSRLLLQQTPAAGVRERRRSMGQVLTELASRSRGAEVLSVACGHLREARAAFRGKGLDRLVALDQDGKSLSEVRRSLRGHPVETVERSVRTLLRGGEELGQYDLIYSLGLYDYLEQRTAARLTQALFRQLRPGGRLMIANFLPIPMRGYMEAFMDWWLVYRTPRELAALAGGLDPSEVQGCSVTTGRRGAIGWLDLQKAA